MVWNLETPPPYTYVPVTTNRQAEALVDHCNWQRVLHLFFKDVGHAGHLNKLHLRPVTDSLENSEVKSFGRVAEDGLMSSHQQHRTAVHTGTGRPTAVTINQMNQSIKIVIISQ